MIPEGKCKRLKTGGCAGDRDCPGNTVSIGEDLSLGGTLPCWGDVAGTSDC